MPTVPVEHDAHLGTGNGLVQFVCCRRSEPSFDALWAAPGGGGAANVFHSPRQAYDLVVRHLASERADDPDLAQVLEEAEERILKVEAAEPWVKYDTDVRPAIEYLAEQLDEVVLNVATR